jgi:hypothetical protein
MTGQGMMLSTPLAPAAIHCLPADQAPSHTGHQWASHRPRAALCRSLSRMSHGGAADGFSTSSGPLLGRVTEEDT